MIVIYIAVCIGTIVFYLRERRDEFNPLVHLVFPLLGATAFAFPLYYQFRDWPANPLGYGNWIAIVWMVLGLAVLAFLHVSRRQALENADRVFVEDATVAPAAATAPAGR